MQSQPHTLGRNSTEGRPRVRVCLLVQAGNNVKDNLDINQLTNTMTPTLSSDTALRNT